MLFILTVTMGNSFNFSSGGTKYGISCTLSQAQCTDAMSGTQVIKTMLRLQNFQNFSEKGIVLGSIENKTNAK